MWARRRRLVREDRATVLSKATTIAAALFMATSLSLSIMATRSGGAVPAIFGAEGASDKDQRSAAASGGIDGADPGNSTGKRPPERADPDGPGAGAGDAGTARSEGAPGAEEIGLIHLRRWRNWQTH